MFQVSLSKLIATLMMTLILVSPSVFAQWYEATGQAKIRHGDTKSAKSRAVQDAIKQALLFSGANVTNVQTLTNGLLSDDIMQVNAHGSVNRIEILEEKRTSSTIRVTIRADIFTDAQQCSSSDFNKKLAITQFPIVHWQDAKIGGVYQFEKEIPKKVFNMLKNEVNGVYPVAWIEKKLNVNRDFDQQGQIRHQLIDAVAENANSQFVMFGRITDLSFGEMSNSLSFWQDDHYERFFTIEVLIANALTHEILYQNSFHTSGEWEYSQKEQVKVTGRNFWLGDYGQSVERVLVDLRNDIFANLSCQQLQSKILAVRDGEEVQLNIGRGQGVKVGQEYRVSYRADVTDVSGNLLRNFVISPYRVRITQVFENSAVAETLDADFMSNVQVNDIIELQDWNMNW
jgi:hypothetical protein